MATNRTPQEAGFVELVQAAREHSRKYEASSLKFADGYNQATQDVLDVIHNNGYVILDKDGNKVTREEYSLACGIWFKG